MPKIVPSAMEQSIGSPIEQAVNALSENSQSPVFICGVNRKVNIGNFENIDIYAGLTLPIPNVSLEDKESLQQAIEEAAAYAFSLVSKETGERYLLIKETQQGS